jgi:hypothetical protein
MPFYIRKSLRAGIFRFNLSKSGIGVSTGIPGFRIGTGPRGNYVHMGRNGLYYRSTLSKNESIRTPINAHSALSNNSLSQFTEIESADILDFQDASSAKLLTEINEKYKIPDYWIIISAFSLILLFSLPILFNNLPRTEIFFLGLPIIIGLSVLLYILNESQKTIILFYTMDNEQEIAYQSVHNAFQRILACGRIRHIEAKKVLYNAHERKLEAGASSLINCKIITLSNSPPKWIKTNIAVPKIPVGRQCLFFFPDRILIQEGNKFGAIRYNDITITIENSRFIETDSLTYDAKVVDQTWKYPNKDGEPDKRFNNNYVIPIILCTNIYFSSPQGLNELIQLSTPDISIDFIEAIKKLTLVISNSKSQESPPPIMLSRMEGEVIEFYSLLGYVVLQTKKRDENTTDLLIQGKNQEKWVARYINQLEVSESMVIDFQQMLSRVNPAEAALISNGVFSSSALEVIKDAKIHLLDKNQFMEYLDRAREKRKSYQ